MGKRLVKGDVVLSYTLHWRGRGKISTPKSEPAAFQGQGSQKLRTIQIPMLFSTETVPLTWTPVSGYLHHLSSHPLYTKYNIAPGDAHPDQLQGDTTCDIFIWNVSIKSLKVLIICSLTSVFRFLMPKHFSFLTDRNYSWEVYYGVSTLELGSKATQERVGVFPSLKEILSCEENTKFRRLPQFCYTLRVPQISVDLGSNLW